MAFVALLALSGCATNAKASTQPTPAQTPVVTPSWSSPSASPSPTASPAKPTHPAYKSLDWYLARVPEFPPAPPVPELTEAPAAGTPPFWLRVPTDQKVAFITIDDGALARPADVPAFIREAHIPVTMFLNSPAATEHTDYFKQIEAVGGVVENHTINHPSLRGMSYAAQHHEICGSADKLQQLFGKRATLFRPPFGDHDDTTLAVAHECGAKAVLYWSATVNEGIVRYQTPIKLLQPGDVLLMHFRPALMDDLLGALKAIHKAGLTPALLEDYVTPPPPPTADGEPLLPGVPR
ncbi:hypothetical protein GCM10009687_13010 [Asanoa iriomotensis]|uniref:NodB homology domain-containing protein n=2 Tax=Asanoa iriomotensis TaxID=234613 RepID=A0ABQ4CFU4_9ACTN|nr:hypothetical protein Air01nite_77330 [Asanoa iriomotensis]